MSTNDLFGGDEGLHEESDDSFIVDSEPESEASGPSAKPANDEDNLYYEFLFGSEQGPADAEKTKKSKKSASKWQKELDRRMKEVNAQYADVDNVEEEVAFSLDHLAAHFERRQGVESEMLALFSGLLTREQFVVETAPSPTVLKAATADIPEADRATVKMMKKLIRQTFNGRTPEGRFGSFGKAAEEKTKKAPTSKISTVVTIGKDALSNMQDLNILLSREREGDYVELDGVPLYKHTRYGTLYIYESNFITNFVLPLCSKVLREPQSVDYDIQALTQEIVYFLYQLSQPPSEAWYNYWTEAQPHYRAIAHSKDYEKDPQVSMELKRRARIVWHYLDGMAAFRAALQSGDLWALIGEFRLNLESFERANYQTPDQKKQIETLQQLQNDLANERDALLAQEAGSDDEEEDKVGRGRLKRDHSATDARKKRIQEIRQQLFNVNDELAKQREAHMEAQQQTRVHIKTIRLLVTHLLAVPGEGLSMLCMLQESGLLSVLKLEIIACFNSCKKGFSVSSGGDITPHPAYLSEQQRESLWEYVRLAHSLLVCLDIGGFLGVVYNRVKPPEMQAKEELLRSAEETLYRHMDDASFLELMRINPKLARMTLRGQAKMGRFAINERFGGTRNYSNYDQWFRFPAIRHLQEPFETYSGISSKTEQHNFPMELLKSLQSELESLMGIDSEFEHCHWTDEPNGDKVHYELGLMLSLCMADLYREAHDRYYQSCDHQVVMDLHSIVVTYYRCLHTFISEICRVENRERPPETYVLLALRRYVGSDSWCAKVCCAYLWQLIRKQNMSKSSHIGATSALRALYADLCLMRMFWHMETNLPVIRICQETMASYFIGDIRAIIFWILRYFKPLSHSINLFAFGLSCIQLMKRVIQALGSVSFTQENMGAERLSFDYDSESSDDGNAAVRTIVITPDAVYTSRNRKTVSDDIIYNGRVVYNCIAILSNFRTNSVHINDLLISHLEIVPLPMFYDAKYFYVFREIVSDKRVWQNARWRWIGDFCSQVLESFFDAWLGRGNRFLPVELFFNKCAPSTKGPFRPCARENIIPISRGYERCDLLNGLLRRPDSTVYDVSKEMRGGDPSGAWDPEEDAALLQYHKKFMFLDDPASYIAELLGRRTSDVVRRLQELDVTGDESPTNAARTTSYMHQILHKLVKKFADEAIRVCAELHDNVSESLEMQKLGGAEAVCEVMEPLSASSRILESFEFKELLKCLGISPKWLLPKDTSNIGPLMDILADPSNYVEVLHGDQGAPSAPKHKPSAGRFYVPPVFTSRDIAKLILSLSECLDRNNEPLQLQELLLKATALVESATVIGSATAVFEGLPQSEESLSQLSAFLQLFSLEVNPPMLVCSAVKEEAVALDRLKVALSLSKLSWERLESIVNAEIQHPVKPAGRQKTVSTDNDMDDSFEQHLDMDGPITFNITKRPSNKTSSKKSKSADSKPSGKARKPGTVNPLKDPSIRPALEELHKHLVRGETRTNVADLMGIGAFDDWEVALGKVRSACQSLGCSEETVDGTLWLLWPADRVDHALSQLPHREKRHDSNITFGVRCLTDTQPLDLGPFQRLEIDRNLVASLYSESLRLAREGHLENTIKSKEDLERILNGTDAL